MPAQDLNARLADCVTEANARVTRANEALETSQTALAAAESAAAAANPPNPALDAAVQRAKQDVARAQDVLNFHKGLLDRLLRPRWHDRINWAAALQYVIFASLAFFVLQNLVSGITNSPPAGTTPRSMITFLIAVVTVGIALILVLASIVSDSPDREKRFSQGKEVLTALLGVLGTIVGFYFGISQDQVKGLYFDPVVISKEANEPVTLSTSVRGGKAPYSFKITFTPASISPVEDTSLDGHIKATIVEDVSFLGRIKAAIAGNVKQDTDVSFLISVTDSEGKTGSIEYKKAVHLKPASDGGGKKN